MALSAPSVLLTLAAVRRQTLMFAGKVQEVELPAVTSLELSRKGQITNLTESFPTRLLDTSYSLHDHLSKHNEI